MTVRPRRAVWYTLAGVAATTAVVLYSFNQQLSAPSLSSTLPLPEATDSVLISLILLPLGVVVAVGAYLLWLWQRDAKSWRRTETARPHREDIERRIAVDLEP